MREEGPFSGLRDGVFFKLENSGLTISGFGIEILLYSGLLDFKFF
jgi:hypothetical protein